ARVGAGGLLFLSDGLPEETMRILTLTGRTASRGRLGAAVQSALDTALGPGKTLAVFPEGPYCVPESIPSGE
ncbi:MAG: hypothetical protein PHX73_08470, partial [Acidobacteriota bacterium]|nr:hypothetical protein [Acidobacteriota bacterium]